MNTTTLISLIDKVTLYKWRENYEKDKNKINVLELHRCEETLIAGQNEDFCKLVQKNKIAAANYYDELYYLICSNILHTGFKLGMEFAAFNEKL